MTQELGPVPVGNGGLVTAVPLEKGGRLEGAVPVGTSGEVDGAVPEGGRDGEREAVEALNGTDADDRTPVEPATVPELDDALVEENGLRVLESVGALNGTEVVEEVFPLGAGKLEEPVPAGKVELPLGVGKPEEPDGAVPYGVVMDELVEGPRGGRYSLRSVAHGIDSV